MIHIDYSKTGIMLLVLVPIIWVFLYALALIFKVIKKEYLIVYAVKLNGGFIFFTSLFLLLYNTYLFKTLKWKVHYSFGHWFSIDQMGTSLEFAFSFESFLFINLMVFLTITIARFSRTYLHKEHGFNHFFFLIGIFMAAFNIVVLANNFDLMFVAWELIGLTSALLIAYYSFREQSVINSFWALISYRISDMFFITAIAYAHIKFDKTNISELTLMANDGHHNSEAMIFCILLIIGGLAKGAQFPFVSWPMRAMEGPTSSSALYYGALSVSLGPILLLKNYAMLEHVPAARLLVGILAILTAPVALLISKVRSDIKSTLAYSSIFHISIICLEIALGFKWLAIFHLISNAFIRIDQFLRSFNIIQDFYENPLFYPGANIYQIPNGQVKKSRLQKKIYHLAVNGFGFDWLLQKYLINRWLSFLNIIESTEDMIVQMDPMIKDHHDENLNQENLWNLS